MAGVVVHFDVGHVGRLLDALDLPHIAAVAENVCIFAHGQSVTLKVHDIHLIVPDQSLEQTNVTQSESVATQELLVSQVLVKLLHVLGVSGDGLVVCLLTLSEAAPVDTVVDVVVDPGVHCCHFLLKGLRV